MDGERRDQYGAAIPAGAPVGLGGAGAAHLSGGLGGGAGIRTGGRSIPP